MGAPHFVSGERMVEGLIWCGRGATLDLQDSGASVKKASLPEERHHTRSMLAGVSAPSRRDNFMDDFLLPLELELQFRPLRQEISTSVQPNDLLQPLQMHDSSRPMTEPSRQHSKV